MKQSITIETSATRELCLSELDGVAGGKGQGSFHIGGLTISWGNGRAVLDLKGVGSIWLDGKEGTGAICSPTQCVPTPL